jgi:uncharacterized protein with ParB-like and HNH nuclease domain
MKVKIPKFQRGVVWNIARKKNFISSVKNGDPFGVILVYKENGDYLLIDGLQRLSTLVNYQKNPLDYLDEDSSFQKYDSYLSDIVDDINVLSGKIKNQDN